MGKLDRKVAIVTGASRGIGKATAQLFAAEGAKVVCAARTVTEGESKLEGSLTTTVAEIKAKGGTALAVPANLIEEEACEKIVEEAKKAFGHIDILVNNAILTYYELFKDVTARRWTNALMVSVHAPISMAQKVLPDMIERRSGAIVNISSGAAIGPGRGPYKTTPARGSALYGGCKAFIERFTQGLAEEVYQYGITVASLAPSQLVMTPSSVYFNLGVGRENQIEPVDMMARGALLLVSEPLDKVTGRATYSQAILKEFGWIKEGHGTGVDTPGSGYSRQ